MNLTCELINIILWLITASISGTMLGLFSYFLDYCFWPGSIFKSYLPWLAKIMLRNRSDYHSIKNLPHQNLIDLASDIPQFKLLGGCSVCFNVHLSWISFLAIYLTTPVPLWCYLPYLVVSSFIIRKANGID
jgi:hypothetical protein